MALGYQSRREQPPVEIDGILLRQNDKSYQVKLDGVVTPLWLPQSQVEFHQDGETQDKKACGRFSIPKWLAKKEGIA